MNIISGKRACGKTNELIKRSLDTGIPILVLSEQKRESLQDKSISMFHKIVETITLSELSDYDKSNILIDDIDEVVSNLIKYYISCKNINVDTATITIE